MLQRFISSVKAGAKAQRATALASVGLLVLGLAATITPSLRASEPWEWRDLSQSIPSSVQTSLTLAAGRGEDWLVSNGERLWSVNAKEETADYSDRIRGQGSLRKIASDGSAYLLGFQGLNGPTFTQTNLQQWTELADVRFPQQRVRDLQGAAGRWAILTEDAFENATFPRRWQAALLDTRVNPFPQMLRLPEGASDLVSGCIKETSGSTICNSESKLVPLNGEWYLVGGSTETRDAAGHLSQTGKAGVWRWSTDHFERLANAPQARFVSGIWTGSTELLLATTDAVTNPYAADTYWTFDGRRFKAIKEEALEAGLLSVDTRAVRAAQTGDAWVITAGKTLVQVQNGAFAIEGMLRDQPAMIAGSGSGQALIVGQRGEFGATADLPKAPSLTLLGRKLSSNDASYLIRPENSTNRSELTRITLTGDPGKALINSGETFAVRAEATSQRGIRSIDLYVNGNRVSTCEASVCRYVQTYWNNDTEDPRERRVVLSARVTDTAGRVTESSGLVLMIRKELATNPTTVTPNDTTGRMPAGLTWNTDRSTGIGIASWLTPSSSAPTILNNNETRTVRIAATHASGIERIEIWINGRLAHICSADEEAGISFCNATVAGADYPFGGQAFLNARVLSKEGRETWSQGYRFDRF